MTTPDQRIRACPSTVKRRVSACSDVDLLLRDADGPILSHVDAPVHRAVEDDWVVLEASAKSSAAILTSLTKNLTIEDPTDVGFLTGFGAVILVDVETQGRKAPVAQLTRQKPQHQKENGNDL